MNSLERRKKILELVNKHKKILIKDISRILNEKDNNIRRDIRILEEMSLLTKVYGGVRANSLISNMEKYYFDNIENNLKKDLIAKKAFELISKNDSIFLSSGTTVLKLAEILFEHDLSLDIVTISLPVATILAKKSNYNLVFIGGKLERENYSFEGSMVEEMTKYYTVKKAFIGAKGFSIEHGFTIPSNDEVVTVKAIAKLADEVIILVDSSKFLKKFLMKLATFEDKLVSSKIKRVITDKEVEKKYIDCLENQGVEVILV